MQRIRDTTRDYTINKRYATGSKPITDSAAIYDLISTRGIRGKGTIVPWWDSVSPTRADMKFSSQLPPSLKRPRPSWLRRPP